MKNNIVVQVNLLNPNGTLGKTIGVAVVRGENGLLTDAARAIRTISIEDVQLFVTRAVKLEENYGQSKQSEEGSSSQQQEDRGDGNRS